MLTYKILRKFEVLNLTFLKDELDELIVHLTNCLVRMSWESINLILELKKMSEWIEVLKWLLMKVSEIFKVLDEALSILIMVMSFMLYFLMLLKVEIIPSSKLVKKDVFDDKWVAYIEDIPAIDAPEILTIYKIEREVVAVERAKGWFRISYIIC